MRFASVITLAMRITDSVQNPSLRLTNVRDAMSALQHAGILSDDDYTHLCKTHTSLCWLIDSLRVVRRNSKDGTLPPMDSEEVVFLARRSHYERDVDHLRDDLAHYLADVREINNRLLGKENCAKILESISWLIDLLGSEPPDSRI